jgi:hypothetical protein
MMTIMHWRERLHWLCQQKRQKCQCKRWYPSHGNSPNRKERQQTTRRGQTRAACLGAYYSLHFHVWSTGRVALNRIFAGRRDRRAFLSSPAWSRLAFVKSFFSAACITKIELRREEP